MRYSCFSAISIHGRLLVAVGLAFCFDRTEGISAEAEVLCRSRPVATAQTFLAIAISRTYNVLRPGFSFGGVEAEISRT
jgi:hypothetical protein